jgi:CPA1 family monovalent cation:H+ antiporter
LLIVVVAITAARFAWIFGSNLLLAMRARIDPGQMAKDEGPLDTGSAIVMSWAGMRGVVTLAVALSLPEDIPGRDLMLLIAFGVILITVVVQGSTLALVIRLTGVRPTEADAPPLDMIAAERAMGRAQLAAVERLARAPDGTILHPRLLEQYTRRVTVGETFDGTLQERTEAIESHFTLVIAAVTAGRAELVRLHRAQQIDDETLHSLERDLDLEELGAISNMA